VISWVEIDTGKIRSNIDVIRSVLPAGIAVMAVVKANAYGHGLEICARAASERADWIGVNTIDEALLARSAGVEKPILILGYTEPQRFEEVARNRFRQALYRSDLAEALSAAAVQAGVKADVHIKIETGTNRQGVALSDLGAFAARLASLPGLRVEGAYTHFANIEDTLDPSFAAAQRERFRQGIDILRGAGLQPLVAHAAATAGALLYDQSEFSMTRIGIGLYGIWPSRETQLAARERGLRIALTPVLTWKTRVAQIKTVEAGEYVGYGLTFQAPRSMRVAVLPVGYYDGFDRKLSNSGRVLVNGVFAPVIGRVAMNMIMLDVTEANVRPDDEVVLIGRQGNAEIRAEELAEKCGTIAYEVLSRINPLIPRVAV
jgi:alanine racemase